MPFHSAFEAITGYPSLAELEQNNRYQAMIKSKKKASKKRARSRKPVQSRGRSRPHKKRSARTRGKAKKIYKSKAPSK